MTDETPVKDAAAEEEFSAAAPPDPGAAGTGETNFADAEAPPAGAPRDAEPAEDEAAKFRDLAMRKQAEFENFRKRMARENAQAAERGAAKLAKELLPALDHLELSLKGAEGHADADVIRGFALVRDELEQRLRRSTVVRQVRTDVREQVLRGELTAVAAADLVLAAYDDGDAAAPVN